MNHLARFNSRFLNDFLNEPSAVSYLVRPFQHESSVETFKVDIKETDDAYHLQAELPGIKKENLNVTIDAGKVAISVEVKDESQNVSGGKVLRSERYFGAVSRSFQLPIDVDQNISEAKYENGILELMLVKQQGNGAKRLAVK